MIDDDLSYPIEFLNESVKKIDDYDIIIGSRYLIKQKLPFIRRIFSFGYRTLVNFLFNLKVKDPQAGLKLMKAKIFKKIGFPKQEGYVWDTELLVRARRNNIKIYEIPIKYNFMENVLRPMKIAPIMFKDVMQLWFYTLMTALKKYF